MTKAIVLVTTSPGSMKNVLQEIIRIESVEEAHMMYGIYDILAIIHTKTSSELRQVILKIRKIDQVEASITMKVVA